jgi:hypothetical protein
MIATFDVREPIERAKRFHEIKAQAGGGGPTIELATTGQPWHSVHINKQNPSSS